MGEQLKMASRIPNLFSVVLGLFLGGMNRHRFKGTRPRATADRYRPAGSGGFFPFRRFRVAAEAKLDVAIDRFAVNVGPEFVLGIPSRFGFETGKAAPDSDH